MLDKSRIRPYSFEATPSNLRHRYFDEKGNPISEDELLRVENAWRNSTAHVGAVDFRKSLEPKPRAREEF